MIRSYVLNSMTRRRLGLNNINGHRLIPSSPFHETAKREILPLVGLVVFGFIGKYSYRALQRMDEEWEEYERLSEERGGTRVPDGDTSVTSHSTHPSFTGGYVGVDLGTYNLRISHLATNQGAKPIVVENREGLRSTPAIISRNGDDGTSPLIGTMAKAKMYERTMYKNRPQIQFLRILLEQETTGNDKYCDKDTQLLLSSITSNALEKVLSVHPNNPNILFSIDDTSYNVRPIVTYNPNMTADVKMRYMQAVQSLSSPPHIVSFVPEPVAALVGAAHFQLLSKNDLNAPVAILDIGGHVLNLSIVQKNSGNIYKILHRVSIYNVAGYALQSAMVDLLKHDFFKDEIPDGMALQRLHDAAEDAVTELSRKIRTEVNIPYLTVHQQTMQPKHLEMGVSRSVLKEELDATIKREEIIDSATGSTPIENLSSLITHLLMATYTAANVNPFQSKVLLVGGASRSPIFQKSVREGMAALGGEAFANENLIIPEEELVEELVVLGAALCGGIQVEQDTWE